MTQDVSHIPFTPLSLLARTLATYPERLAVVHGSERLTWAQFHDGVQHLAAALQRHGLRDGGRVAFLSPNTPAMLLAHFGVALAGGVLVALNFRLNAAEIRYILQHCEAQFVFVDREFASTIADIGHELPSGCIVVVIDDETEGSTIDAMPWSAFLGDKPANRIPLTVDDEERLYALNYTSGTTGRPKGVMYTHRGAYVHALGEMMEMGLSVTSRYLWTLPMFHCNGWGYTWAVTGAGGTHYCLRRVEPRRVFELIAREKITHMCGAPTVLIMLADADLEIRHTFKGGLNIVVAGAAPSPAIIADMEARGAYVSHVYGLTETYGPHTICAWNPDWDGLDARDKSQLRARQGVPYVMLGEVRVVDSDMRDVQPDGRTLGEVIMRGNNVMKGYFRDDLATQRAFKDGWFHSGDIAVMHPDRYIEIRDRSKDIIISGGENISSIEVENMLYRHPAVLEVAVVAGPDVKWGEIPVAFVHIRDGQQTDSPALYDFCRQNLAHFKCPKRFIFGPLPKTATGKIKKFELRKQLAAAADGVTA